MHPVMRQQLAADRASYMIAKAERQRLGRQARLARRSRTPTPVTPPGSPARRSDTERPPVGTVPASAGRAR